LPITGGEWSDSDHSPRATHNSVKRAHDQTQFQSSGEDQILRRFIHVREKAPKKIRRTVQL